MEILHQVTADELDEMVIDEVMDARVVYMVGAELGEFRQETVGEGLPVDFLDDVRHGRLLFFEE